MSRDLIFWPVLVQVLLTLAVYVVMIRRKLAAKAAGQVDLAKAALDDSAWPDDVRKSNNNIRNQFEVPVLFYVLAFSLWALDAAHVAAMVLSSLFVLSRVVHAWVHLGSNYVPNRRRVFTIGWVLLLALAILLAEELVRRALGYGPY